MHKKKFMTPVRKSSTVSSFSADRVVPLGFNAVHNTIVPYFPCPLTTLAATCLAAPWGCPRAHGTVIREWKGTHR